MRVPGIQSVVLNVGGDNQWFAGRHIGSPSTSPIQKMTRKRHTDLADRRS
jgi:hypothetical protein